MIALSELFDQEITLAFRPPLDEMDRAFLDAVGFGFNQSIQALRKTGWTRETLVRVGQIVLRLHDVLDAYRTRKASYTLAEWLGRLAEIGKGLNDVVSTLPGGV